MSAVDWVQKRTLEATTFEGNIDRPESDMDFDTVSRPRKGCFFARRLRKQRNTRPRFGFAAYALRSARWWWCGQCEGAVFFPIPQLVPLLVGYLALNHAASGWAANGGVARTGLCGAPVIAGVSQLSRFTPNYHTLPLIMYGLYLTFALMRP